MMNMGQVSLSANDIASLNGINVTGGTDIGFAFAYDRQSQGMFAYVADPINNQASFALCQKAVMATGGQPGKQSS